MQQVAVLDACVLYSAPLRDFFMHLAVALYQPKWTDEIHREWIDSVLANRPDLTRTRLERTRELMDLNGGDCLVTRYKRLMPLLALPDPGDRHVLAAAIASKASTIVTFNLSDFPVQSLSPYEVRALHPDAFAIELYHANTQQFIAQTHQHRMALVHPTKSVEQYLSTLNASGLKGTALLLHNHRQEL